MLFFLDGFYVFFILIMNVLPVPVYISAGSLGISFDTCRFCFVYLFVNGFFSMFFVLHEKLFCVPWQSFVIFRTSLPMYVNVTLPPTAFFFCLDSLFVFCFSGLASFRFE
jgi:hypothetical protein